MSSSPMHLVDKNLDELQKLTDCTTLLLNSEQFSDVQFEFPDEKRNLYGHKFIMSIRSSVFRTMFYGAMSECNSNSNIVKIEDVSSASFLDMLKFIYTDQVNITDDNLAELMYVAHKYSIKYLERMCGDYLRKELNKENCLKYLEQFYVYDNDFTEKCLKIIDSSICEFIGVGKLNELSEKPLLMVLKRDSLDVNEMDLFKYLLNWAKHRCEGQGVEATVQNMREKFAIFEMVRFPTMSLEEISKCHWIMGNNFFTPEEIVDIFSYKSSNTITDSLRYSTINRQVFGHLQLSTFTNKARCAAYGNARFSFGVNEIVKISNFNCQLYHNCSVKIFEETNILFEFVPSMEYFDKSLDMNVTLSPNVEYAIETNWSNSLCKTMYYLESNDVFNFQPNTYSFIHGINYKLKKK